MLSYDFLRAGQFDIWGGGGGGFVSGEIFPTDKQDWQYS